MTYTRIEEQSGVGRLGRHINHDERSKSYRVEKLPPQPVKWTRHTPILDQGNLGSCTGNAAAGVLGSDPFDDAPLVGFVGDEHDAVQLYSAATKLDPYKGTYPPDDTGSDGLSVAKAAKNAGWISGYVHGFNITDLLAGLQKAPAIVGTNWLEGMDNPDLNGHVKPTGTVRGGHEYECVGFDGTTLEFCNSWGPGWGAAGRFYMTVPDFADLLAQDGDCTFFVPNTEPAPTPAGITRTFTAADVALLDKWATARHIGSNLRAAQAWKRGT